MGDAGVIYHILTAPQLEALAGQSEYRAPSLADEGFIHASASLEQVLWVANRLYQQEPQLSVLCLDRARVQAPVRDEMAGERGPFPHIYGPLNPDAVREVRALARADGRWAGWGELLAWPLP